MKKLLLLGGSAQQIVAIETAKRIGYKTVLCDYLSDNPGQHFADCFYLVSTTDKEAVLEVARKEHVEGVLAYASDPAAPTAAYVAEKMGLPGNPYKSVDILCNKDHFRTFLKEHGFSVPVSRGFSSLQEAFMTKDLFSLPVLVKPVDSSGSKGITVIRQWEDLLEAAEFALRFSRSGRFLVEEFIEKTHSYLIGGDVIVHEGKVVLWGLMNCHRDNSVNSLVPVGKSYPPALSWERLELAKQTLQQMVSELHIQECGMNVELILDAKNRVFLLDVGPRNGGNMIPELLSLIFRVNVVELAVKAAMDEKIEIGDIHGEPYYATHNLHADHDGIFEAFQFSDELEQYIIRKCIYCKPGDAFFRFDQAAKAMGILFLKFPDQETMHCVLSAINDHIHIMER